MLEGCATEGVRRCDRGEAGFREARLSETGLARITALESWVDTVAAYVSESPRQGTTKEAGLDFWIMCRRGCQPGKYDDVPPLLPPTLEALNITTKKLLNKDVFVAGRGSSGRGVYCSGLLLEKLASPVIVASEVQILPSPLQLT